MPLDPSARLEVTAYRWVPAQARGYVKDMRVRWALEEIEAPYRVRLVGGAGGEKAPEHLADQPFGQVPVLKDGRLTLFESGAILVHIGGKDQRLLPADPDRRARAIGWAFAALNSVEPATEALLATGFASEGRAWADEAKAAMRPFAERRLSRLSAYLADREWLEDAFTIGDLLMVDVLRAAPDPDLLSPHPNLRAYLARGVARPAFRRAMEAHLADLSDEA